MARRTSRWIGWAAALLLLVAVTGCAVSLPWAPSGASEPRPVLLDTGAGTAIVAPPPAGPSAIDQATALRKAALAMTRAEQATAVTARQATLSLAGSDGATTMNGRHAWLVTYEGLPFSVSPTCTCYVETRPNTTVVVDAQNGMVLTAFGTAT
ncbi:MAG: hypothetical protein IT340_13545 [Chloroflexi bacterium]|nr:hypothetical protein [Chloroflexota bacterium]